MWWSLIGVYSICPTANQGIRLGVSTVGATYLLLNVVSVVALNGPLYPLIDTQKFMVCVGFAIRHLLVRDEDLGKM